MEPKIKKIVNQEIWRAIRTPNFEMIGNLETAKREFRIWHATQKWPNPSTLASAMDARSQSDLNELAKRSLAKGLCVRLDRGY